VSEDAKETDPVDAAKPAEAENTPAEAAPDGAAEAPAKEENTEKDEGEVAAAGRGGDFFDGEPALQEVFDALWARVLENWTDDKAHGAFLEFVIREKMLPDAAGRYRAIKDANDERSPLAKKRIDAIVIAATQMLTELKSPPPEKNNRWLTVAVFIGCVILLFILARAVFRR
jgi:hypothetical protein